MNNTDDNGRRRRTTGSVGPLRPMLDLFSSIWFGIFQLSLLFLYCSIGSAMPQVRQLPGLEMTEFEWFHWWPFDVLLVLFCLNLVTVTIRRIRLRWVNAGVWTIHTGIIILAIGSWIYFGTKVEGDAPVFRRQLAIDLPGLREPARLVVLPGSERQVVAGAGAWTFRIDSTNTDWPILSEGYEGQTAYSVNVGVTPPSGEPFVRQLLDGYEQFTEDILPGKGRAIKAIGRKLVDETLRLSLEYEPTTKFHVMDTWALFVRRLGETEWVERPIRGLPRYNDYVGSRDQVFTDPNMELPLRAIDLEVPPGPQPDALGDTPVHVTGYLRYAQMERRWGDGGDRLNPVLQFAALSGDGKEQTYEVVAFDRAHNRIEGGIVEFRWFDGLGAIDAMPVNPTAMLEVAVPAASVSIEVPITPKTIVGRQGSFTPIEGTEFAYRILMVQDDLVIPSSSALVSVAMVEVKTADGQFTRMVADQPEMTRDMQGEEADPHGPGGRSAAKTDPRIEITYRPKTAPLIYAGYPGGLKLLYVDDTAGRVARDAPIGEAVEIMHGLRLRVNALWTHATSEAKPSVVPPARRRRDAGEAFAMIRLEMGSASGTPQARWVQFHQYAFPDSTYAYGGRFWYAPDRFRLPDGSWVELLFSRERRDLPYPIALEDFELDTHVGGYTGSSSGIRNYLSRLRFLDGGKWTEPTQIAVNHPTGYGGYWYFQSTWDPPQRGAGGGMNYTGLGIGNRNGVNVQLLGCCIAVAGMIFAFYVKPVIKRRRSAKKSSTADIAESAEMAEVESEPLSMVSGP